MINTGIFLNNVVVASWQIYLPIFVVIGMVLWYVFSKFARTHLLFIYTLFLTVFIPLYPKLPLEGIRNTFVYIRLDDVFVSIGVCLWFFYLLRKQTTWKSPLAIPILMYWGIGLLSTIVAVVFIFPGLVNVFPHDAWLFYLRHIEYLIVFFLAFSASRDKRYLPWFVGTIIVTVLLIEGYGFGQAKYPQYFLAYSTMNEQFAKGIPLVLQSGARIQATFAGHYDLAAYLVMIVPLIASMIFGYKNLLIKLVCFATSALGLVLLLMTASRTSYAVYLVAITFMLILQRKKLWILPVLVLSILLLLSFHTLSQRFADTLTQQSVVVDARTGKPIGIAQTNNQGKVTIVDKTPVGQNLAPGSGYIVSNTSAEKVTTQVIFSKMTLHAGSESAQITDLQGDFVIKKALAYDDSFTTRLQGEWPRAMQAFLRDPFLGSGYSSISLATDNNYLRILGETGVLGFASFLFIFLIASIYAYRVLPDVTSVSAKSLVIGTFAGILGLALNAILIDVFESSKVAYTLWMLLGVSIGTLVLYQKKKVDYKQDLRILLSTPAFFVYFLIASFVFYASSIQNFFVADDFTWLHWVAATHSKTALSSFFTNADGFFYRPMEKLYFYVLYNFSGFNPVPYHVVSVLINWLCTWLIFILSLRILKNKLLAFLIGGVFLVLSTHTEDVYWISASGHLFVAFFTLLAVLSYDQYIRSKRFVYFILSFVAIFFAPLFHESGIVAGVLVWVYAGVVSGKWGRPLFMLLPIPFYVGMHIYAKALWSAGDYAYNLAKLPFNVFGNMVGYMLISMFGLSFVSTYAVFRQYGKSHVGILLLLLLLVVALGVVLYLRLNKKIYKQEYRPLFLAGIFFIIPLLPFLGLGNLAARYSYLSSFGVCLFAGYIAQRVMFFFSNKQKYMLNTAIVILAFAFAWYNYQQILLAGKDWTKAGAITQNFLQDISYEYETPGSLPPSPIFYFSNVPQTYGQAYVFPTGLSDAIWMTFQNNNIVVKQTPSLAVSMQEGESTTSARFYEFDSKGNVIETQRKEIPVTPTPALQHGK